MSAAKTKAGPPPSLRKRVLTGVIFLAPSILAAILIAAFSPVETPAKTWILLGGSGLAGLIAGYFRGVVSNKVLKVLVGFVLGLSVGVPFGATVARLLKDSFAGDAIIAAVSAFSAIDFLALVVIFFYVIAVMGTLVIAAGARTSSPRPQAVSEWRMAKAVGPFSLVQIGVLVALLILRHGDGGVAVNIAVWTLSIMSVALMAVIWPRMDELNRNLTFESYSWSFLVLFFAAPPWLALQSQGLVPVIGAFDVFVLMTVISLVVTVLLGVGRFGREFYAEDPGEDFEPDETPAAEGGRS